MTVSAPYYGDSAVMRTPPPDLPSLLLKERIVYLGLPLFSDDDSKRQLGMDVTELIIAQLLFLESENPKKDIFFYINSFHNFIIHYCIFIITFKYWFRQFIQTWHFDNYEYC